MTPTDAPFPYGALFFIFLADDGSGGDDADAEERLLFFHPSRPGDAERQRRLTLFGALDCFRYQVLGHLTPAARPDADVVLLRLDNDALIAMAACGRYRFAFGAPPHIPDPVADQRMRSVLRALRFHFGPLPAHLARVDAAAAAAAETPDGPHAILRDEARRMAAAVLPLVQATVQHPHPLSALDSAPHAPCSPAAFLRADQVLSGLREGDTAGLALWYDGALLAAAAPGAEVLKWVALPALPACSGPQTPGRSPVTPNWSRSAAPQPPQDRTLPHGEGAAAAAARPSSPAAADGLKATAASERRSPRLSGAAAEDGGAPGPRPGDRSDARLTPLAPSAEGTLEGWIRQRQREQRDRGRTHGFGCKTPLWFWWEI